MLKDTIGKPKILNTDQMPQFTAKGFAPILAENRICNFAGILRNIEDLEAKK